MHGAAENASSASAARMSTGLLKEPEAIPLPWIWMRYIRKICLNIRSDRDNSGFFRNTYIISQPQDFAIPERIFFIVRKMTMRTLFLFNRLLNTVFKHGIHIQRVLIMLKTLLITVFRVILFNTCRGREWVIHPPAYIIS